LEGFRNSFLPAISGSNCALSFADHSQVHRIKFPELPAAISIFFSLAAIHMTCQSLRAFRQKLIFVLFEMRRQYWRAEFFPLGIGGMRCRHKRVFGFCIRKTFSGQPPCNPHRLPLGIHIDMSRSVALLDRFLIQTMLHSQICLLDCKLFMAPLHDTNWQAE